MVNNSGYKTMDKAFVNDVKSVANAASTDVLTAITGYDASKTQILKNVEGTLTWVDEA